jgi:phosphoserine phosphatase RsbU/P
VQPGGTVHRLESTGRPLGLLPGGPYEARSVSLQDGDYLFFYTDGLSEAENEAGVEYGTDQLEKLLQGVKESGIEKILARVEDVLRTYRGSRELSDDATMLLVKVGV